MIWSGGERILKLFNLAVQLAQGEGEPFDLCPLGRHRLVQGLDGFVLMCEVHFQIGDALFEACCIGHTISFGRRFPQMGRC